jgi:GT2 family glycosyltransferase/glycosyltransferase involved in cell wall biosynthesis
MPDVRVGIVSWNTAGHLRACLEALPAALGDLDAEVVIVDNASRDDSAAVAEAFGGADGSGTPTFGVRIIRNLENRGYARAMNQALAGAQTEVLVALNPDTVPPADSLRDLVAYLRGHPDVGVVAPRLQFPDGSLQRSVHRMPSLRLAAVMGFVPISWRRGRIGERWWLEGASDHLYEQVVDVDWVIGAVHVIRTAALGGHPPYSERWFMYVEDLDLCARLHASGHRVVLDGEVTITHVGSAAGDIAWGERRDARWLDAMYDWYARERSPLAARAWAAINLLATLTKLGVVVSVQPDDPALPGTLRERYRTMRRAVRLHLSKLLRGTRLGRSAGEPPADRPKRVLAVVPGGQVSGAEMVLLRDLTAARMQGWGVRCACTDGPLVDELIDAGIAQVPIPDLRLPDGPRAIGFARVAIRTLLAARHLRRIARRDEIVLANGVNTLPALRFAGLRSRTVFFAHDVLVREDRLRIARFGAAVIDVAVAVSDAVAAPLRAMGIPTVVVHNGTAWPVEPAPDVAPSPPVVGCSALLTEWKGQHVLLEAMTRVARPDAVLELMGATLPKDGDYAAALERRAAEPDLAGRVRFLGHIADPLARLRHWSVAVSASIDPEAGPLTALEAMSVGVPFVATDHGGVTEVLGDAGLLVPPGDADALADAINRLLDDTELRARCQAAGPPAIVARHLTVADQRQAVLSILDELAPAGRATPR